MEDLDLIQKISAMKTRDESKTWRAFCAGLDMMIADFQARAEDLKVKGDDLFEARVTLSVLRAMRSGAICDNMVAVWEGQIEELKAKANPPEPNPL